VRSRQILVLASALALAVAGPAASVTKQATGVGAASPIAHTPQHCSPGPVAGLRPCTAFRGSAPDPDRPERPRPQNAGRAESHKARRRAGGRGMGMGMPDASSHAGRAESA